MAIWTKCQITDAGKKLIAECQADNKSLNITTCSTSSHDYSNDSLTALTALENIEQTVSISDKSIENNDTIKLVANFENTQLATGYKLYSYGIYANNGGDDVLLLVGVTDSPDDVPPIADTPWQAIINTHIKVNNVPDVTIQVSPAANATMMWTKNYVFNYMNDETPVQLPTNSADWAGPDATTNLYTITIPVANMTKAYKGATNCDYVRLTTDTLEQLDEKNDAFQLIKNIVSGDGEITVYAEEIPTIALTLLFYGVNVNVTS